MVFFSDIKLLVVFNTFSLEHMEYAESPFFSIYQQGGAGGSSMHYMDIKHFSDR